jgi:2-polyprenyl-3-methyl-5-hydroxy-6-metoxy-1,4-benzoquinol methylase
MTSPWGSAAYSHTLRQVTWMASTAVLMHLNERATGDPARDWLSSWAHRYFVGSDLRVLVLGCGEGWLERTVAQWPYVARIDAVDAAAEAVERARAQGGPKIHYAVVDLNEATLEANAYDVVIAHSVLHHVAKLEHAFEQIERAMKPDATLIVNEYVGPNRFQFSDYVLALMNELLASLGYPPRRRPSVEVMIQNDPTEAVRAEDIVPMIEARFAVVERKALGGTLLMHLLYEIVQAFRWEVPHERGIIELLCTFEAALVDTGRIASDFAILAAGKKPSARHRYSRPLPPRTPLADDTEPDPLGFGRAAPGAGKGSAPLRAFHLRMLRIALASARSRRANLIAESRLNAFIEQLRFAAARTTPFDWMRRRWSARDSEPRIAALLDTFERHLAR